MEIDTFDFVASFHKYLQDRDFLEKCYAQNL